MKISFLNHASVLIEMGDLRLLTDPWFEDYCFNSGWGLRYDNGEAYAKAKTATHLWVSHYHGDHFHPATLRRILADNPGITVIGNHSYNFQLDESLRRIGFQNVISFPERKTIKLDDGTEITRFPTTGIDNMLLIRSAHGTVLDYNDCSLPIYARKKLAKRIGHVDLFLSNFNHAGKLLLYPYPPDNVIKKRLVEAYRTNLSIFDASFFLPFASYHYYRAPESVQQNTAMLDIGDLQPLSERIIPARVGDDVCMDTEARSYTIVPARQVQANSFTQVERPASVDFPTLAAESAKYCRGIRGHYLLTSSFLPRLHIKIADLGTTAVLHPSKGLVVDDAAAEPHIVAHSAPLKSWFADRFGTDSFVVGAHFEINHRNKIPLKWQIIFGLLVDNKLDLKSVLRMLFSAKGLRFLVNRREEIVGVLLSFRVSAEYHD